MLNPIRSLVVLRKILQYSFFPSKKYYEGKEKSRGCKFLELILYFLKTGEFLDMYYAFGLNIKGTSHSDYIGKKRMKKILKQRNFELRQQQNIESTIDYDILTKDKFYLTTVLKSLGLPVIDHLALISNNKFIDNQGHEYPLDAVFSLEMPCFLKNTILEYNEGILLLNRNSNGYLVDGIKTGKEDIKKKKKTGSWIVQDIYKSSLEIRRVNDTALNTTRIVTVFHQNGPEYLTGFQAFATASLSTDHWGKGALYVGFHSESEKLYEFGFYHPAIKELSLAREHPDSQVVFKDYQIPGLIAAIDLCKNAHRYLYYTYLIGWDVAITDEGPKILEANEMPGMNAVQCVNGGLRYKLDPTKN